MKSSVAAILIGLASCIASYAFSQDVIPEGVAIAVYSLDKTNDSLYVLTLKTDSTCSRWPLPYPVYRFCTGDIDGDGSADAMVGVVKSTRYFKEKGRRLFIFKNYHGEVRPLWLGSKLGGILDDFRFINGRIRSLERTTDRKYVVAEYVWDHFGMSFNRFLAKNIGRDEALRIFEDDAK